MDLDNYLALMEFLGKEQYPPDYTRQQREHFLLWEKTLLNTSKPVTPAKEKRNPIERKISIQSLLVNHLTELV
ncbi:hypothetical protein G9A89_013008 [Geosiphon pyriformis]|nr:hypothetical protein G9A89_013008 [Geosiphon pyriformis]